MKYCACHVSILALIVTLLSCQMTKGSLDATARRFHPGHYVAVGPGTELRDIKHLDEPALRGVNKRWFWRTLEPAEGAYDFSSIEADLQYLREQGKQLVVFLMDKSFSDRSALPGYLSQYEFHSVWGGLTPARWHPYYIERLLALGRALGERFDKHPNFEGVALQESSLGIADEGYSRFGYTPERYRDALVSILKGMQTYLPSCHVFWYSNFLPGNDRYLYQVADAIREAGVFMGGPDILPYRRFLSEVSYPMYEKYKNTITLFGSAQGDSYRHHRNDISVDEEEPVPEEGYLSMEEIFRFAQESLHVRYVFWDYEYEGSARTFDDAVDVIRKYPVFNTSIGPYAAMGK